MKKHILKALALTTVALTVAACGNKSHVTSDGTTDAPNFPNISNSVFNHDGSQFGSWPNWDNVRQIERGMNKAQLYYLIGRPHFDEGLFGVREWDYVFNYREDGVHKVCQYKVLFDKNMNAQQFYWYPNGCNGNSSYTLSGDFLFDFDKDNLSTKGHEIVQQLASKLMEVNAKEILVEGHTDRMGSDAYNLDLSQRRANVVKAELERLGVQGHIIAKGLGKAYQVKECEGNDNAAKACLAPNRRVEVRTSGKIVNAESNVKSAGQDGPAPLYDTNYPHKPNPYPTK